MKPINPKSLPKSITVLFVVLCGVVFIGFMGILQLKTSILNIRDQVILIAQTAPAHARNLQTMINEFDLPPGLKQELNKDRVTLNALSFDGLFDSPESTQAYQTFLNEHQSHLNRGWVFIDKHAPDKAWVGLAQQSYQFILANEVLSIRVTVFNQQLSGDYLRWINKLFFGAKPMPELRFINDHELYFLPERKDPI